jgi:CDP-diacylglycerol pyrophosphatase
VPLEHPVRREAIEAQGLRQLVVRKLVLPIELHEHRFSGRRFEIGILSAKSLFHVSGDLNRYGHASPLN